MSDVEGDKIVKEHDEEIKKKKKKKQKDQVCLRLGFIISSFYCSSLFFFF